MKTLEMTKLFINNFLKRRFIKRTLKNKFNELSVKNNEYLDKLTEALFNSSKSVRSDIIDEIKIKQIEEDKMLLNDIKTIFNKHYEKREREINKKEIDVIKLKSTIAEFKEKREKINKELNKVKSINNQNL